MEVIKEKTTGNMVIKRDSQYNDVEAQNVVIAKSVTARIYGNIKGLLTLKAGSRLYLHGVLYGSVQNEGGELHVFSVK